MLNCAVVAMNWDISVSKCPALTTGLGHWWSLQCLWKIRISTLLDISTATYSPSVSTVMAVVAAIRRARWLYQKFLHSEEIYRLDDKTWDTAGALHANKETWPPWWLLVTKAHPSSGLLDKKSLKIDFNSRGQWSSGMIAVLGITSVLVPSNRMR